MFRIFALVLLLPALAFAAPAVITKDIPRFQQVADGFYRGGQPGHSGFEFLKKQGVKTIINLKEENDEEPLVRSLGMNYVHIPMSVTVWTRISDASIRKYFEIVSNPENFPLFIHCERGADRTGVMVGFYRIAVQGWDGARAIKEAREVGMRWWYSGLKDQLNSFKPATFLPTVKTAAATPVP